jgi:hypothetical protein
MKRDSDSRDATKATAQPFQRGHEFGDKRGQERRFRVALPNETSGEIRACLTLGNRRGESAEPLMQRESGLLVLGGQNQISVFRNNT